MLVLGSIITIGNLRFKGVNAVSIRKSILDIKQTGVIKIPSRGVLKQNGQRLPGRVETRTLFKEGDPVKIELAYNGRYKTEFVGFVSRVNLKTPTEIEVEGYSWILRKKKTIVKSWKTTTLLEVLQECIKDTDIKLHAKIPDIPLKNLVVNKANGAQLIEYLKDLLKGTLTACFFDNTLYCGLTYGDVTEASVKYLVGYNIVSADELKYREAKNDEINIEFQIREPDGKLKTISAGKTGGATKTEKLSAVTDAKHMEDIAKAKLLQQSYDGYEGALTAFLVPFLEHGYKAEFRDKRYPERSGNYFVVAVQTEFGQGGARRKVEIGLKLS